MAYNTNIDYKAIQNALKPQIDAETDATKKAALQAQYDAAQASREQKIASDLTAFGKYATDSELDSAAGIQATNQIGTTYDTRARNISTAYDTYKQNANNDALSRGMARSSFVSDRMANLDTQRGTALTNNDMARANAIQNAKTSIIDNFRTNSANTLANDKSEYANTIGAYYGDYQSEVNKVQGDNDPSNDWKIPYLQQARNQKIAEQEAKALEAQRYADKMAAKGSGGGSGTTPIVTIDDPKLFDNTQKSQLYAGTLNDAAASYQVGMNRTSTGQLATIQQLLNAGQITEAQATALINKFKLG